MSSTARSAPKTRAASPPKTPSKAASKPGSPTKKKKKKGASSKLADEKRKKEERENEQRERDLMEASESESRAYERSVKYQIEEKERRDWEKTEINTWEEQIVKSMVNWKNEAQERDSWRKFLEVNKIVDPMKESELNTWISLWRDKEEGISLEDTLSGVQNAEDILREIEHLMLVSTAANDKKDPNISKIISQKRDSIDQLRTLQQLKIDKVSAHLIQRADEFASAKNEVILMHKTNNFKYGLWVNINKNPRVKKIEYNNLNLSVDIPKNLALTSVAMRMIAVDTDYLAGKYNSDYITLGGLLATELLALPPPPKKVKGWTLRQVTPLSENVSKLPYPPITNAAPIDTTASLAASSSLAQVHQQNWPPLRISFPLPAHILVPNNTVTVGWWDSNNQTWETSGIAEVEYDPTNRTVAFKTSHAAIFAVIQDKYLDLPYEQWRMRPSGKDEAIISLKTKTKREIEIKVEAGYCSLHYVRDSELRHLDEKKLLPAELLTQLGECGLFLLPEQKSKSIREHVTPKDIGIERRLCADISRMASAYAFSQSRWNNQKNGEKSILFQFKESLDWEEIEPVSESETGEEQQQQQTSDWKTCLYQEHSCFVTKLTEHSAKYSEDIFEGAKLHEHLYHCLRTFGSSADSEARIKSASVAFIETVRALLVLLRLTSFGK